MLFTESGDDVSHDVNEDMDIEDDRSLRFRYTFPLSIAHPSSDAIRSKSRREPQP